MAEDRLIIMAGETEVLSAIALETMPTGHTRIRVTSSCGGVAQDNMITLPSRPDYSPEQMEYDVEVARHRFAEELAGKARVQAASRSLIQVVSGDPPVSASGPRVAPPGGE